MTTPTGIEGALVEPGSAEWMATMSASKIAAVVGLSKFQSRFDLWHRMAGTVGPEADNADFRRGHYLEPAIAAWFADQHPDWTVETTGTWTHPERSWQSSSPDRLVRKPDSGRALLECKSDVDDWQWGEEGTDEIPVGYRAQALWQLDTVGLNRTGVDQCHVAVLLSYLEFREYVVTYDADEAAFLRDRALAFIDSLNAGDAPDIDSGSDRTYQIVRELHPDIEDTDVELNADLARRFCVARHLAAEWESEWKKVRSQVAQAMGRARRARWDGHTIAQRQVRGDGLPFVVAGRRLPTFQIPAAEVAPPREEAAA